jgi:GWxTD domain-containing protein
MQTARSLVALGMAAFWVCSVSAWDRPQKKLSPQDAEFLSEVRYLITKQERKEFLALPDDQKPQFIEQFWKKRDTDPATPTNEFKEEYLQRIRQADELFVGETRAGWLTDRGRVYVLYGPPTRRETTRPPAGKRGPCVETWHYDDFPVGFSDENCSGSFSLTTKDLSRISSLDIARAATSRSLREAKGLPFDFEVRILKRKAPTEDLEAIVLLEMPYSEIWFDVKDGKFETTFAVEMVLEDSQKVARWQYKSSYPVMVTAAELKEKQQEKFRIEIPMVMAKNVAELRAGRCRLTIIMENETSKERIRKVAEFNF